MKRLWIEVLVALTIAISLAGTARAERVLVQARSGEMGHAWLFGAPGAGGGECWLAAPLHVVADPFGGGAQPFTFTDRTGKAGESALPVAVSTVPAALAATGGVEDLAFARVALGRERGQCLSRLGLPPFAYETLLRQAGELTVFSLLATSFGIVKAEVSRGAADASGGGLLELRARNAADGAVYFKRGLSGSTAEAESNGGALVPFAMILRVDPDRGTARALRFDRIRAAFERVAAAQGSVSDGAPADDRPSVTILSFEGEPVDPGVGPSVLTSGGCWKARPRQGEAHIRIVIEVGDRPIKGLALVRDPACGAAASNFAIDQRRGEGAEWSHLRRCDSTAAKGAATACPLDLRGPRQLRLTILASGITGLAGLVLR